MKMISALLSEIKILLLQFTS